jgi:hypothetical protein
MCADKNDELKRRAVAEILAETRRAEIRADDFGASGWLKPKFSGFNKRFLNNTVVATVSNNCRLDKTKPLEKLASVEKPVTELPVKNFEQKKFNPKIKVNSKSRFQAYLAAKKREANRAEVEATENNKEEQASENKEENPPNNQTQNLSNTD